jgi:hypothetical protein
VGAAQAWCTARARRRLGSARALGRRWASAARAAWRGPGRRGGAVARSAAGGGSWCRRRLERAAGLGGAGVRAARGRARERALRQAAARGLAGTAGGGTGVARVNGVSGGW